MSDGFAYLDILFFAMVAAFIAFRLRNVLGRRTGHERRRLDPISRRTAPRADDKVVPMPERTASPGAEGPGAEGPGAEGPGAEAGIADVRDDAVKAGLTEIRLADPSFNLDHFLQGARAAFAMIIEAFAKGDKAVLRPLLADEVFAQFAGAIDAREQAGQILSTEIVAMRSAEILAAAMQGTRARITVRFTSEQINLTRDRAGAIVEGDPRRIETVIDVWAFERDTRARDPNWQLVETSAPA